MSLSGPPVGYLPVFVPVFQCSGHRIFGRGSVRVAIAMQCVAQNATLRSTAQHPYVLHAQCHNGIAYISSIVLAAIGGQLGIACTNWLETVLIFE